MKQPQTEMTSGMTAGMTPPFKKGIESDMMTDYNTAS